MCQKSVCKIFIFRMKLQKHKVLKVTYIIFWGKNLVFRFSCQKGSKWMQNDVFQVYEKMTIRTFLGFCIELQPKIGLTDFLGKILF